MSGFSLPQAPSSNAETGRDALSTVDVGNVTATLTVGQLLKGLLHSNPGAAATFTLPTAALLVAGDKKAEVGTGFQFSLRNDNGVNGITVAAGAGGTLAGAAAVSTASSGLWYVRYDDISSGTEAYTLVRLA